MQVLSITPAFNARNMGSEKETVSHLAAYGLIDGAIVQLCEARFYMARKSDGASPVYCSIWIHAPGMHASGYGRASGYGYHKESAALDAALQSAGVVLSERIDGCGSRAMESALQAIGEHCGATGVKVF